MFEAGKKYIFSRSAYWSDNPKLPQTPDRSWWVNLFDGHVFVGLGGATQTVVKDFYSFKVLPEWCVDGEVELI